MKNRIAAALASAAVLGTHYAQAQLEEVIVTASKIESSIQDLSLIHI